MRQARHERRSEDRRASIKSGHGAPKRRLVGGIEDWRLDPRMNVDGEAFWSAGRIEGSCRLVNLSMGGAAIEDTNVPLRVGSALLFTLRIGDLWIEGVRAEVARIVADELGLRFLSLTASQRTQIRSALGHDGRS